MATFLGKTILITGGTGFIGKPLSHFLAHNGAKVFVLTRKPHAQSTNITYILSLQAIAAEKIDIIINLAGETIAQPWTDKNKEKIRHSRLSITSDIVNYIKSSVQPPALLISASAIGYYGMDTHVVFDEETHPINTHCFSHQLCADWEKAAKNAETYGVRTVFLRIGAVLEKDGGMLKKLLPLFYCGFGSFIGHGRQWLSWIDRDDLIELISYIINTPSLHGPINAVAPTPVSNFDFSKTLASVLSRPCFLSTPSFLLRLVFGQMANELMVEGQKVVPKKALASGFKFLYPELTLSLTKTLKKG